MFEPNRGRRAAGEEPGEARAELLFEPNRGRRAAGEEPGEARAESHFEPNRGRRAAGEEPGEARAESTQLGAPAGPGEWLIFADAGGVGRKLAAGLRARGAKCVVVTAGAAYRRSGPSEWEIATD